MNDLVHQRQLYSLSSPDCVLPNYVDHEGKLHTRPAGDLPMITWPDRSWCPQANTHMRELFERGLSRHNRGGTLSVAAAHISHLLRFCWKRRVDLIELTDNQFREFITELSNATRLRDPSQKQRDANSVISIGRSCLALLESVARHSGDPDLLGPTGRIRASLRQHIVTITGKTSSRSKTVYYYDHAAFPNADTRRKRMPIATAKIEQMRSAVVKISTSSHQRVRRHATLKLLETTAARRGEIALLTVDSVRQAYLMEQPMLHMPTLKKRGGKIKYRYVPISRADLSFLLQYADVHRRSVVRRTFRGKPDHGILLVSDVTGLPLKPKTITQEIRQLAQAAGIQETACPHMFRHRFLTKIFVALVEQHAIENPDRFRQLLIDSEDLKRKVAEWTDHSDLATVDRYIDLAFDEIGNYKRVYALASAGLALDSFVGILDAEIDAISMGEQPVLVAERLKNYIMKLKEDLSAAHFSTPDGVAA